MNSHRSPTTQAADNRLLSRIVLLALAALIVVVLAFAGFYYWDRYVHLGDQSPLERNVAHLEQVVRENPDDPEARLALAQFYLENRMFSDAIEQSQQILEVIPDSEGAYLMIGMAYTHSGQLEAAIEPLEIFTASRREHPMADLDSTLEAALYFLGRNYIQLDRAGDAIPVLIEALHINRTDADAMYQLGLAYARQERHEIALEQYHNAVVFVPNFSEAYLSMAESYTALGMVDHLRYARGMEAFSNKDYNGARAELEQAAETLPDSIPVLLGLGLTYEQLGELQLAQASFERVLQLEPGNFTANNAFNRIQLSGANN